MGSSTTISEDQKEYAEILARQYADGVHDLMTCCFRCAEKDGAELRVSYNENVDLSQREIREKILYYLPNAKYVVLKESSILEGVYLIGDSGWSGINPTIFPFTDYLINRIDEIGRRNKLPVRSGINFDYRKLEIKGSVGG